MANAVCRWVGITTFLGLLLCNLAAHGQSKRTEIPPVPEGHPRVYVRPSDLPAVKAKLELPEFRDAWQVVQGSQATLCRAFVYLVIGDDRVGRDALEQGLQRIRSNHEGLYLHSDMHQAACAYDWCYDLLTDAQKRDYIEAFKRFIARDHNRGYPPQPRNPVVGHDCEGWIMGNLLPAGLAVHDEDPEMYAVSARMFFDTFIEPRDFLYPAHSHHQGDTYAMARFGHDQLTSCLFRRIGADDVFSREQQFVPYQLLYSLRPDTKRFRRGDCADWMGVYYRHYWGARLTSAYYDDPYLLSYSESKEFSRWHRDLISVFDLLFLPAGAERRPLSELPLTKFFGYPMGSMIARTGWNMGVDSGDAMVYMIIGEHYFGNHQHRDFGTFQIYHRGPLALDTGLYQGSRDSDYGSPHWANYHQQTVAHNGLMIFDPATADDDHGGQRKPMRSHPRSVAEVQRMHWGRVTAHGFGPDPVKPQYSHIAGDITNAYYPSKAKRVTRAMATLNTGDERYPCIFAVYDIVESTKPEFKKAWYLHTMQEPKVDGRTTTIVCNSQAPTGSYQGRLNVHTLLPRDMRVDIVGGPGKECWNEAMGRNYGVHSISPRARGHEMGAWRMEVVPTKPALRDVFLNVMTVSDENAPAPPPLVLPIETPHASGARVLDFVVVFRPEARGAAPIVFDIPGRGECAVLVCGMRSGRWRVESSSGPSNVKVAPDAGCAFFHAPAGQCKLEPGRY